MVGCFIASGASNLLGMRGTCGSGREDKWSVLYSIGMVGFWRGVARRETDEPKRASRRDARDAQQKKRYCTVT
jgi:hypothetical protein